MSDCKRSSPTIVSMNENSPNGTSVSKKRKITASVSEMQHQLPNSPEKTVTLLTSVNCAPTVACDEYCTSLSRFSSSKLTETGDVVKKLDGDMTPLDPELKTKSFETVDVDPTNNNLKSLSLLSELSEDSKAYGKTPMEEEIDDFFSRFEREERKWFIEKYNFDIVKDMPLDGRYEWVRLH